MDKDLTTSELYLKQGDVMKRILENLLGQQELDIEVFEILFLFSHLSI